MAEERKPKILVFGGSLRRESLNKKAAAAAAAFARAAGAETTLVDLADYRMPVYDGDLEDAQGVPEPAKALKALMKSHDGFLISTPEYNTSIPGPLKNVIDWVSRQEEGEAPLACFAKKTAALISASPGALGGIRALAVVRAILENLGTLVLPQQVAISKAHEAFAADGTFADPKRAAAVKNVASGLVDLARRMS
ncbi:MAG TPA: NAD(P)H-dependent oxidoreductase [Elusimicrobiota bacterium]|jgi:NAD(P)H-dependent FMN reductase|nr:NAD(P)H-dependent oxidoreductase [Elusimicrobiota bacterium]